MLPEVGEECLLCKDTFSSLKRVWLKSTEFITSETNLMADTDRLWISYSVRIITTTNRRTYKTLTTLQCLPKQLFLVVKMPLSLGDVMMVGGRAKIVSHLRHHLVQMWPEHNATNVTSYVTSTYQHISTQKPRQKHRLDGYILLLRAGRMRFQSFV